MIYVLTFFTLVNKNVMVFPSRSIIIENAIRLFSPRLAIVDENLTRQLPKHWLTSLAIENAANAENKEDALMVIEAPCQSDLMIELIKKLKPQVVVTGMAQYEATTSSAFENLLRTTGEIGCRLFLDISDHFELSSLPKSNGVLKYLSGNVLPSHAAIICGLIKNKVYSDLEVAFVISEDESVSNALSKIVELLEGNTALFSQYYYGCLFHELLAFQISGRHPPTQRITPDKGFTDTSSTSSSISVLNETEFSIDDPKFLPIIHMDVDQNFLPIPSSVKASIFESFARQNITEVETDVQLGLQQLLKSKYGFVTDNSSEFIYGNYPLALFNRLVLCCIQERGTLLFPSGTNGHYTSAAKFLNAKVASIPTELETGFKIVPEMLESVISKVSKPWVYISGPTINPTGSLYSHEEIKELLQVCACYGARVIIDTSFSGLEFNVENWSGWDLQHELLKLKSSHATFCVSLIGGLSFEMLSGGLGFGYLVLNDSQLTELFHSYPSLSKPHSTVKYAVKKLLGLRIQNNQVFLKDIAEQKVILKNRTEQLSKTLKSCGWDVLNCYSGGSMVAKPSIYIGKKLKIVGFESELSSSNIREALVKATGLCINSESWTGIPDYCRLTIALEQEEFKKALKCIKLFKKLVLEGQYCANNFH